MARLDAIHLNRAAVVDGRSDMRSNEHRADREYEAAFREAGFGEVRGDPEAVAARMRGSNIRDALVAALDDWAVCAGAADDQRRQGWILEAARRADRDPTGCARPPPRSGGMEGSAALTELSEAALAAKPSVQLLVAIGERLQDAGGDAIPFLQRGAAGVPRRLLGQLDLGQRAPGEEPRGGDSLLPGGAGRPTGSGRRPRQSRHRPGGERGGRTRRSTTSSRPSASTPSMPTPTTTSGRPGKARGDQTRLSTSSGRPSRIDPEVCQGPLRPRQRSEGDRAAGRGHAGVPRGCRPRPQVCRSPHQPRHRPGRSGAAGRGCQGVPRRHRPRPQGRRCPTSASASPCMTRRNWTRPSGAPRGHRPRPQGRRVPLQPRHRPGGTTTNWTRPSRSIGEAIALDPKYAAAHYNLGNALRAKNDLEGAVREYQTAIDLRADLAEPHCNLGLALGDLGRFADGLAELRKGHELGSKQPGWSYPSAQWVKDAERPGRAGPQTVRHPGGQGQARRRR